jgi:hypothetical protein
MRRLPLAMALTCTAVQCPGLFRRCIEFGDESDLLSRDAALDELAIDLTIDDLPVQPCAEIIAQKQTGLSYTLTCRSNRNLA